MPDEDGVLTQKEFVRQHVRDAAAVYLDQHSMLMYFSLVEGRPIAAVRSSIMTSYEKPLASDSKSKSD